MAMVPLSVDRTHMFSPFSEFNGLIIHMYSGTFVAIQLFNGFHQRTNINYGSYKWPHKNMKLITQLNITTNGACKTLCPQPYASNGCTLSRYSKEPLSTKNICFS